MHKRLRAALAPAVIAAAIAGAAGFRVHDGAATERLDELSRERPAAASDLPVEGVLVAASDATAEARWTEAAQAYHLQLEAYYRAVAAAEAERAQQAQQRRVAPARTGRGGGGGSTVRGACGGATNGADRFVAAESGGNPNARNPSGAWGCYQIMPGTWRGSCSDLGQHGSASTDAQAQCASRLPSSSWAATGG